MNDTTGKVLASGLDRKVHPKGEQRETVLNQPSKEQLALPFYNLLPKDDPIAMLRWKIYVRERCMKDLEFRELIIEACRRDIVFWAASVCYVFEPRPPRDIPLTPWSDQADVICWLNECFYDHRDCIVAKTRGIGLSWDLAILFYHKWLFVPQCKLGLMSKDEDVLDGPDANSLMGKIVYLHQKMPAWLRGRPQRVNDIGCMRRNVTQHLLLNMANGATVQGFAPTDSKVRSLRFTAFGYDEFAYFPGKEQETLNASVHTAPTRYFISTWHGAGNAFHDIMCRTPSTALRVSTYWWNNPERWKGAYTTENGRIKILDKAFKFPPDYPFVDDGLLRCPWVDYELSRAGNDMQTALEELYGLQAESGRKLLRPAVIEMAQETCRDPLMRGDLDKSGRNPVFREGLGDVYIWQNIVPGQGGPYAAGCDLAFGRGASYSALEVFSLTTGEQVMEFADKHIDIISFARYVADLLRWLNGSEGDGYSYVTFENNGDQANSFGGELLRLGYGNVARRKYAGRVPKRDAPTYLGTRNKDGGRALLIELGRAIYDGEATIRSAQLAHELGQFDKDEKDKPEYPRGEDGHGDRAQAAALAWDIARDRIVKITKEERESAYAEIMRPAASKRRDWAAGWKIKRGVAGL